MNRYSTAAALAFFFLAVALGAWFYLSSRAPAAPTPTVTETQPSIFEGAHLTIPSDGREVALENDDSGVYVIQGEDDTVLLDSYKAIKLGNGSLIVPFIVSVNSVETAYLGLFTGAEGALVHTASATIGEGVSDVAVSLKDEIITATYTTAEGTPGTVWFYENGGGLAEPYRLENGALGDAYIEDPKPFTTISRGALKVQAIAIPAWVGDGAATLSLLDANMKEIATGALTAGTPDDTGALPLTGTITVPAGKGVAYLRLNNAGGNGFFSVSLYRE